MALIDDVRGISPFVGSLPKSDSGTILSESYTSLVSLSNQKPASTSNPIVNTLYETWVWNNGSNSVVRYVRSGDWYWRQISVNESSTGAVEAGNGFFSPYQPFAVYDRANNVTTHNDLDPPGANLHSFLHEIKIGEMWMGRTLLTYAVSSTAAIANRYLEWFCYYKSLGVFWHKINDVAVDAALVFPAGSKTIFNAINMHDYRKPDGSNAKCIAVNSNFSSIPEGINYYMNSTLVRVK